MPGGIYVIRNRLNGDEYVGQTKDFVERWDDHRKDLRRFDHHNRHLKYAWRFYGEENFEFEIIEVVDDLSQLDDREIYHGVTRKPAYNLAPFGQSRRNVNGRKYSDEIAERVRIAFELLSTREGVIMPSDIAAIALCCPVTMWRVLRDAPWWTEDHRRAARQEAWRRALATQEAGGWESGKAALVKARASRPPGKGRAFTKGYSEEKAQIVLEAFYAFVEDDAPTIISDISRETQTARQTVRKVLRNFGLWSTEQSRSAMSAASKRGFARNRDTRLDALDRGRQTMASQGYPNLEKAWEINQASGYVNVRKAAQRAKELGNPGLRAYQAKADARAQIVLDWLETWYQSNLIMPKVGAISQGTDLPERAIASCLLRLRKQGKVDIWHRPLLNPAAASVPMNPQQSRFVENERHVLAFLQKRQNELAAHSWVRPRKVDIAEALHMSLGTISDHLKRLRKKGVIADDYSPITPLEPSS